jgi:hypothetical protein
VIDEEAIKRRIRAGVVDGLLQTQLVLSRTLRQYLSRPGGGRRYRVARGRKNGRNLRAQGIHVASAPGQPPAVNTGRLRQSWALAGNASQKFGRGTGKQSQDLAALTNIETANAVGFTYGSNLKYARMLEYGTRRGLRPRPYVRPVFAVVSKRVPSIIQRAVKAVLGG